MQINYSNLAINEEVSPDEWDLKMLEDIDKNPDCHEFISQEELLKELDLSL